MTKLGRRSLRSNKCRFRSWYLAQVLGLDQRDIYLLANPRTVAVLVPKEVPSRQSAWEHFRRDKRLQRLHNVAADEMEMLACVARMGQIESPRTFAYILNAVRYALGR